MRRRNASRKHTNKQKTAGMFNLILLNSNAVIKGNPTCPEKKKSFVGP